MHTPCGGSIPEWLSAFNIPGSRSEGRLKFSQNVVKAVIRSMIVSFRESMLGCWPLAVLNATCHRAKMEIQFPLNFRMSRP